MKTLIFILSFSLVLTASFEGSCLSNNQQPMKPKLKRQMKRLLLWQRQRLQENQNQISQLIQSTRSEQLGQSYTPNSFLLESLMGQRKLYRNQQILLHQLNHNLSKYYRSGDPTGFFVKTLKQMALKEALSDDGDKQFIQLCRSTQMSLETSERQNQDPVSFIQGVIKNQTPTNVASRSAIIDNRDYTNGADSYKATTVTAEAAADHLDKNPPGYQLEVRDTLPRPRLNQPLGISNSN